MRVLFLSPSNRLLGARKSLIDLVRTLRTLDVDALVVCPGEGDLSRELLRLGIAVRLVPQYPWRKAVGNLMARTVQLPRLRRIVGDFRPDVIHANEYHIVPQAVECAKTGGARIPVVVHVRNLPGPSHLRKYRLDECAGIVAVSAALRGYFDRSEGRDKVTVVHNGIDLGRFRSKNAERVSIPETAHWPKDCTVFGLLGLIDERKNQQVAVGALRLAADSGADVRLLIAGDAFKSSVGYGEELARLIDRMELRERVVWLPFQEDVLPLYRAIDVNLLVSREEGFGRTIIEAGAMGRPSIGSNVGGIPDIVLPGETGWLVPAGDAQALAAAMCEAVSDRARTTRMGVAAAQRARDRFSIESTAQGVLDVYRRVARQGATS